MPGIGNIAIGIPWRRGGGAAVELPYKPFELITTEITSTTIGLSWIGINGYTYHKVHPW